jgi:hypothetical protein
MDGKLTEGQAHEIQAGQTPWERFNRPWVKSLQNVLRELPQDREARKVTPIATGVLDYFPLALAAVARVSKAGNDQHNPGEPLHWNRGKSSDHADCIIRHLLERGLIDTDGMRHSAKTAWRALALLQEELENEAGFVPTETK